MITRRKFIKDTASAAIALAVTPLVESSTEFDLLIRHATVLDGTGEAAWKGDVAIQGDKIAALGKIPAGHARQVIDATGLHLSPGFVDIHSHSDESILEFPNAESRTLQGITTEITGNCGSSAAPAPGPESQDADAEYKSDWTSVASYFKYLESRKMSLNQAMLLGQGTLRSLVVGEDNRKVSDDELRLMLKYAEEAMDQGTVGLSTGLEYVPGIFTPVDEIVQLARVARRYGGFYASHIRNEEAGLLDAVQEAIEIGKRAEIRVQISHLKAAGRANWDKQMDALALIDKGRKEGIDVKADAYPYSAWSTSLDVLLQPWVRDGGTNEMLTRLGDSTLTERLRKEIEHQVQNNDAGYDGIYISRTYTEVNRHFVGKNLVHIADEWNIEPVDAYIRLLIEEAGEVSYIGHGIKPENVKTVLAHPFVMIGTDGRSISNTGSVEGTKPHPRSYGTYPRFLGHYVRDAKLLDWPSAIRKCTAMPADQAGLKDRGRIARNFKADIVIFNASTLTDTATFESPHQYPVGVQHVIVNGVPVVRNAKHTGAKPGRVLRRSSAL